MRFFNEIGTRVILFDGAMGTQIHRLSLSDDEWGGHPGCNEILNISAPERIEGIHRAYLAAGADVIETNTFGASRVVLAEYGLSDRVEEVNEEAARIARKAIDSLDERGRNTCASGAPEAARIARKAIDSLDERGRNTCASGAPEAARIARKAIDSLDERGRNTCASGAPEAARIARKAIDSSTGSDGAAEQTGTRRRYVAGSMGPGSKLPSLGQIDFDTLRESYEAQARGLLRGGVDLLLIETCQDLLQIKCAVIACRDAMAATSLSVPVAVSFTIESSGTLLVGSDIGAVIAALIPLRVDILGLNCALGPEQMRPYIAEVCRLFPGPVICQPNAGLPEIAGGKLVYSMEAEPFADHLARFVTELGVSLVGGCCGTSPEYIAQTAARLRNAIPAPRHVVPEPRVSSLFTSVSLDQIPKPFFVGERNNTNGSKEFREALLSDDWDRAVAIGVRQQETGAHGIDVCVAYAGRNEKADMETAVSRLSTRIQAPLFLDSTDPAVLEAGLKRYGGRAVINSINLEDGEDKADRILALAERFGAAVIALTIDEEGMARDAASKLRVALRLSALAFERHRLPPGSLLIDPLTFTLGSGDEGLRRSALETLEAIRLIKERIPGALTILGVSNVSFGLSAAAREVLNTIFLREAVAAGLDCAIVNVAKILPLPLIPGEQADAARRLIRAKSSFPADNVTGGAATNQAAMNPAAVDPLLAYIELFREVEEESAAKDRAAGSSGSAGRGGGTHGGGGDAGPPEERLAARIARGDRSGLSDLLKEILAVRKAGEIISDILIPAMRGVGELFGAGKLQLPFVLQSAEAMREAVNILTPFLEKSGRTAAKKIVLATVRGDVHDIGKNLVDIILSNNGYEVHNLGIKCEIDRIIDEARRIGADAVGMSGLLVKSTQIMRDNIGEMARRGLDIPVLLGGAALTERFVSEECAPLIGSPVFYCRDAFDGLAAMERISSGGGSAEPAGRASASHDSGGSCADRGEGGRRASSPPRVLDDAEIPRIPFIGTRLVEGVSLDEIRSLLNEQLLFKIRWGYRRGRLSEDEYRVMLENRVKPELEALADRAEREGIFLPAGIYGYFPCRRSGNKLILLDGGNGEIARFPFPRRSCDPKLSIVDYFRSGGPADERGALDFIALQAVTLGPRASEETARLFSENRYREYLLMHGLAVEMTEAFAELLTERIREELGLESPRSGKEARGKRYSFGYPSCPDLGMNRTLLELLDARRIGIELTDTGQMVPEQTTCAFFVHHPEAEYFVIE
jgi:5-methyltetrahydrofolate--homocysteine methyltransferase